MMEQKYQVLKSDFKTSFDHDTNSVMQEEFVNGRSMGVEQFMIDKAKLKDAAFLSVLPNDALKTFYDAIVAEVMKRDWGKKG